MSKIIITHMGAPIHRIAAAHKMGVDATKLGRRLARMKRRNPKLEQVTVQRLIELTEKHKVKS